MTIKQMYYIWYRIARTHVNDGFLPESWKDCRILKNQSLTEQNLANFAKWTPF